MEPVIQAPSSAAPATGRQETAAAHESSFMSSHMRSMNAQGPPMASISSGHASSVERIDKIWVTATMDQRIASVTNTLDQFKEQIDGRLDQLQAAVTQAGDTIGILESQSKRHGDQLMLIRQAKMGNLQSSRQSNNMPQIDVENMVRSLTENVREMADFIREETQDQVKELQKLLEAESLALKSCRVEQAVIAKSIDTKLLMQNISSSLFTLEVMDMQRVDRDRITKQLNKQKDRLASHTPEVTGEEDLALALSAAMPPVLGSSTAPQGGPQLNSLVQWEAEGANGAIPSSSPMEPAAAADTKHSSRNADGPIHQAELLDNHELNHTCQQELKALDSKLSLLILSSNLCCMKAADLPSTARNKFTAEIEGVLAKRNSQHGVIDVQEFLNSLRDAEVMATGKGHMSEVATPLEIAEEFSFPQVQAVSSVPASSPSQVEKTCIGPKPASILVQVSRFLSEDGSHLDEVEEFRI
eukprot:TRINITY_DN8677_c0_g1_i1.p1 TRINITY_DN8677_c0_g1~~TRINITY_DN8677_c0_g1_i1.p1  ORF type:complete len:528 (-),score=97.35 TRINITY_DN8677_c0_g1_i1:221-1633(-)